MALDGEARLGQGDAREASRRLEEALRLMDDEMVVVSQRARFTLARAVWTSPADRPRARELAAQARAGYQKPGTVASEVAKVDDWLRSHR